jgi:HSP20 family protein
MANDSSRWSPFHELDQFKKDFDGLLDRFLGGRTRRAESESNPLPPVESYTQDGRLIIRIDLPGVDPNDVEITATGDQLTIRGKRERVSEEKERDFFHREVYYGAFERTIKLPEGAKSDEIKAIQRNGVLELSVPLAEKAAARKISIKVEPHS